MIDATDCRPRPRTSNNTNPNAAAPTNVQLALCTWLSRRMRYVIDDMLDDSCDKRRIVILDSVPDMIRGDLSACTCLPTSTCAHRACIAGSRCELSIPRAHDSSDRLLTHPLG